MIRLIIPLDPNVGSKNRCARMHHAKRTRIKNDALATARMVWVAAGRPRVLSAFVDVTVRRGRMMDVQNIIHSTTWAAMVDGIFKDGVTKDDSPTYLRWGFMKQETGKQWAKRPEIVLEIHG